MNMYDPEYDPEKFYVSSGTVQCYISREQPHKMIFFGRAEYDRAKPILTDHLRAQGQAVCDKLNAGEIDVKQAEELLEKVWY